MAVALITDSSSDLPDDLATAHGIGIVPLTIRFGEEEFVDRGGLTPAEFWARSKSSPQLPQTAAPSPGAFEEAYRRAAESGADAVVCVTLSSKLSATIQAARAAAEAVAADLEVKVVDSKSTTLGLGLMVVAAAEAAAQGASVAEVVRVTEDLVGRTRIHGALDTLENLRKGGRIGGAQALLGSLLSIKPMIEVRDGAVEPGPKQRTRSKALAALAQRVAAEPAIEKLAVLHGDAPDVDVLLAKLADSFPRERIIVGQLGPVVGSHTGPRTIGVAYQVA